MPIRLFLTFICICFVCHCRLGAQVLGQPNIDFELGNTSGWNFYVGHCCPLVLDTATVARPFRHEISSGTTTDVYGGFPIVSPDGGSYSLKLGNSNVGGEAEQAEYLVHVPAGLTNYSLIFRYAVVFEDPGHPDTIQPRFAVNAFDSASGTPIECAQYLYVSSSNLPGFKESSTYGVGSLIKYKEWTTASLNLSGYEGRTVNVQFTSGDCGYGGHFGYGYIDVSAGLFAVATAVCNKREAVLSGPFGFDKYTWYDDLFTQYVGTGQYVSVPNPGGPKKYAVILEPYPGYGCPDTLYTTISPSELDMQPIPDFRTCKESEFRLTAAADGGVGPLSYNWSSSAPVSCNTCASVISSISAASTTYIVKVSDSTGCNISDTVRVRSDSCSLTLPNAFTPNMDGLNDIFRVIGIGFEYYFDFSLSVYNRYGQRVFYTTDIYDGWDGIFNGIPEDVGTYFYMVLFTTAGKQQMLKGDVTLIR